MTDTDQWPESSLLAEVISVLRAAPPVPAAVVSGAEAAYGWRSVMAAIADLEFDSAVDDDDLARVRSGGNERRLRFRGAGAVADLSVIDDGHRLAGRLEPPIQGSVVLRHPGRPDVTTRVDELGQFLFENLPKGAVSVRTVPTDPDTPGFQTEWVTI
jgi:hypothetical protein